MNKKKSELKVGLPTVGITKLNQTSKSYNAKITHKFREIQDKNIYFQMPSIHHNQNSIQPFDNIQETPFKKMQIKIMNFLIAVKQTKWQDEWEHYMKKSEILNNRNYQFTEIEDFLLKTFIKVCLKMQQNQQSNSFTTKISKENGNEMDEFSKNSVFEEVSKMCGQNGILGSLENKGSLNSNFGSIYSQNSPKNDNKNKSMFNSQGGKMQTAINTLNYKNAVLDKKVEIYQHKIIEYESIIEKEQLRKHQKKDLKELNHEIIQTIIAKNKFKQDSELKFLQIQTLTNQLHLSKQTNLILHASIAELQTKCSKIIQEHQISKEFVKYKDLWAMATEETNNWRILFEEEKNEKIKSLNKIKILKEKNKQLLNYFNLSNVVNADQEEDKQNLDKIIKQFKEWLKVISVPKVNYNSPVQKVNSNDGSNDQEGYLPTNDVSYKLLRPNFYIFFQAFENTILMEKNIINIRPIEYHFFSKIRAMFNSLFNNFNLSSSFKEWPSFPEFVIGFLEKYQVNYATNKVQFRKKPIESEEKLTFLVNLFNKNFCNTWECEIFRNFLLENYTLDEIYFFLDCRNQLISGISTDQHFGGADPIIYVKLSKAIKVVTKKLAPYENFIIERVKNILKSKVKIKFGQKFLDKYFILKLLLEVYALEKIKSQRIFEASFKQKTKKSSISYGEFHNFMSKNFMFLTSIQMAQLYRQTYLISSGNISHKAIHYICGMKGLFIPLILSKRINQSTLDKSLNNDMLLLDMQNNLAKISPHLEEAGVEGFMRIENSINTFLRQIDWYKGNKVAFHFKLYAEKCKILKINTFINLQSSLQQPNYQKLEEEEIQSQMIELHSLLHQDDLQIQFLNKQKDKRSRAMKMLVRNFKIRIQESIMEFQKVNDEQIKKLKEQIQAEHEAKALKQESLQGQTLKQESLQGQALK